MCPTQLISPADSMARFGPIPPQVPPAVQVAAGYVLHVGSMSRGALKSGAVISAEVDHVRRGRIVPNHTFTHVLNYALREVRRSRTFDPEGCALPFRPLVVLSEELEYGH